jgi:hypothetical protein
MADSMMGSGFWQVRKIDESHGSPAGKGFTPWRLPSTCLSSDQLFEVTRPAGSRHSGISSNQPTIETMKHLPYPILMFAVAISVGCNEKKAAINDRNDATKEAIDVRKNEVNAAAKEATKQTDANAALDKAKIEAGKDAAQAQLDAEKKKADAAADAAKAKVDAENP